MEKKSLKRNVYESVDDEILFWDTSQKPTENRIHAAKGLKLLFWSNFESWFHIYSNFPTPQSIYKIFITCEKIILSEL